jgi:RNA ligase (TIGR02306 family)
MEEKRKLVSIVKIDDIQPIENADKIEVASIGGWKVVISKNEFKIGDEVFYFEIDSMLPLEDKRFSFLEIHGKKMQNGILYHRLKTIKLRGQISQGLILPLSIWNSNDGDLEKIKEDSNSFAKYFNVVKYEEPVRLVGKQKLTNWPDELEHTDEERIQNLVKDWKYEDILSFGNWVATEKIDGCSITIFCKYDKENNEVGSVRVCSRNFELYNIEEDPYWKVVKAKKITRTLESNEKYTQSLEEWMQEKCNLILDKQISGICLQGELFGEGIQNNRLGVKGQHIRFYNLLVKYEDENSWTQLPINDVKKYFPELEDQWVPIMEEFTLPDTLEKAIKQTDGIKSHVPEADKSKQIEGIVWRLPDKSYITNKRIKKVDFSKIPEEKWELVKENNIKLETKKASFKCISNEYLLKNE